MTDDPPKPEGGDRPRRRRRRRGGRGPRSEAEAGAAPERASAPAIAASRPEPDPAPRDRDRDRGRRRRRRGGQDRDDRERPQRPPREAATAPRRTTPPPAAEAGPDVDEGWSLDDPSPAVAAPTRAPRAPTERPAATPDLDDDDVGLQSMSTRIAWGDDSDAPVPTIALAIDLPAEPGDDDPDPVTAPLDDLGDDVPAAAAGAARNVVGVKFSPAGKISLYDAADLRLARGDSVVVETERGVKLGTVAVDGVRRHPPRGAALRRVLRRPNQSDRRTLDRNDERGREVLARGRDLARHHRLPIKVFRAEFGLGGGKCIVYYSSEDKVDARHLARDLSQELHCRVELRQTGVRDEAKMVGGIGSCGMELCCTTWLPSFVPVSIKNAKDQGLVLNPSKVSGQCGRLKCCLVYEQETYAAMRKGLPKLGKRVVTEDGEGRVVEVDVLRQRIRVNLGDGNFSVYAADAVKPMFPAQGAPHRHSEPEPEPEPESESESEPEPELFPDPDPDSES